MVIVTDRANTSYTETNLQEFIENSGNTRLDLYPGQSLVFKVAKANNLQLECNALKNPVTYSINNGEKKVLNSNTGMYYPISAVDNGKGEYVVTITNNFDKGTETPTILNIGSLKEMGEEITLLPLESADFADALASLRK